MNFQTEICNFNTADHERLHGALLSPPDRPSDLGLIQGTRQRADVVGIVEVIDRWLGRISD